MAPPEFVVAGHVVRDLVPQGWRLGGTATYAAVQAQRLGLRVGIVTRAGPDLDLGQALPDAQIAGAPSACTTTFQNVYERGKRRQSVLGVADKLTPDDVPLEWRSSPIVLVGPVCGEVSAELGRTFTTPLLAVSAQGWLRSLDSHRHVRKRAWRGAPFWTGARVLFVSDEDIGRHSEQLERWCVHVPLVALTRNRRGARVHMDSTWRSIDAFPADDVDPTGAGDVFATAFLVEYSATSDVPRAARFASAAAACSIEAPGIEGIAGRDEIETRMAAHPELALR